MVIDRVALVKRGDNVLGSTHPFVCMHFPICMCVCNQGVCVQSRGCGQLACNSLLRLSDWQSVPFEGYCTIHNTPELFPLAKLMVAIGNSFIIIFTHLLSNHSILASCPWGPATAHGVGILTELYAIYVERSTSHRAIARCFGPGLFPNLAPCQPLWQPANIGRPI